MSRFPSFVGLVAFDAVARKRSFTDAAADIGVTQSAVSHQVKQLEIFMAVQLIERNNPGVELTLEGAALAAELAPLLDGLARIGTRQRAQPRTRRVRIGVGAALSSYWLARRFTGLLDHVAPLDVELVETAGNDGVLSSDIDLALQWVHADKLQASPTQRILFREEVFPVCHPALLRLTRPTGIDDLVPLRLLHKRVAADHDTGTEWAWATWFRIFGRGATPSDRIALQAPQFSTIGTILAAALEGAGVALGRSLLVRDALQDGRLIRPLDPSFALPSSKVHVCRWHADRANDDGILAVVDWLVGACGGTTAAA